MGAFKVVKTTMCKLSVIGVTEVTMHELNYISSKLVEACMLLRPFMVSSSNLSHVPINVNVIVAYIALINMTDILIQHFSTFKSEA